MESHKIHVPNHQPVEMLINPWYPIDSPILCSVIHCAILYPRFIALLRYPVKKTPNL